MTDPDSEVRFTLVRDAPLHRVQQALGLIPESGYGLVRRILLLVLVTWVPIVVWAALNRRLLGGGTPEPLLQHFGVHVRCLVAIPLFIAGEAAADAVMRRIVPFFVTSGIVERARPGFVQVLRATERVRDSRLVVALLIGLPLATTLWMAAHLRPLETDEVRWAVVEALGQPYLGLGGWWFVGVVRPLFSFFLLLWAWRLVLVTILFYRIARLELELVPTHPDRAGGLGFLELLPLAFGPVVLGASAVVASRWGHDILFHGKHVGEGRMLFGVFLIGALVLVLFPVFAFFRQLTRLRANALLEYGALVGRHGREVRRRWIRGEPVDDDRLLGAPEIGPVADTIAMYEAVVRTRSLPIGLHAVLAVVVPALLPMIPVLALDVPLKDMLVKLVKTLL